MNHSVVSMTIPVHEGGNTRHVSEVKPRNLGNHVSTQDRTYKTSNLERRSAIGQEPRTEDTYAAERQLSPLETFSARSWIRLIQPAGDP
jgi:hypothetical protein